MVDDLARELVPVARLGLAAVFLIAAVAKLRDAASTRQSLIDFGAPERMATPGARILPLAEATGAGLILFDPTARFGAVYLIGLLTLFTGAMLRALRRGERPECQCFGQMHSSAIGASTIARNAALMMAATLVCVGPAVALIPWIRTHELLSLGLLALAAGLLLGRATYERAPWRHSVFRALPSSRVEAASGERVPLRSLADPDRGCVLTFVSPNCLPCQDLMPELLRWQNQIGGQVPVYLIALGGEGQEGADYAGAYWDRTDKLGPRLRLPGTPSALYVGPDGKIASRPVAGSLAIENLIRTALGRSAPRVSPGAPRNGQSVAEPERA